MLLPLLGGEGRGEGEPIFHPLNHEHPNEQTRPAAANFTL